MFEQLTTANLEELRHKAWMIENGLRWLSQSAEDEPEPLRPGLAGKSDEALRLLLSPLDDLVQDLMQSASESAGLAQAIGPPARGEEAAALKSFGLSMEAAGRQHDQNIAPTWDMHLQRWLRRHHGVVDRLVADHGATGRSAALAENGLTEAEPITQTAAAWALVPGQFENVGETLAEELRRGTPRSYGLIHVLEGPRTLGAAALHLRRLHDAARPVLELLAQQATWTSYAEGHRLGAIDGTHATLREAGALPGAGSVLTEAGLPADVRAALPRYRWSGPQDEATCGACSAKKQQIVYALGVDEMPSCQAVCAQNLSCRHHWAKV